MGVMNNKFRHTNLRPKIIKLRGVIPDSAPGAGISGKVSIRKQTEKPTEREKLRKKAAMWELQTEDKSPP